jgi:small subunit ribosomal protein S10
MARLIEIQLLSHKQAKIKMAKAPAKPKKEKAPAKAKAVKAAKAEEVTSKLRIRVRAYESKILDLSVKQIIDTALRYDAKIQGPIPLPTEIKKYTVNRAPFIYKNAREQFEMRIHKRLIDILNPTPKIIESLTNLSLPSGVNIDVKLV